jgi:hypothetical protein
MMIEINRVKQEERGVRKNDKIDNADIGGS